MPDTTGTINAKKLGSTGFTEDMVDKLYSQVGRHHMAIVDLQVINHSGPDVEGKRTVTLIIDAIEPAVTDDMAEHLRELMRTVYFSRGVGDQLTLTAGADEPTVEGVLAAGAKHKPHPFLPVDASQDNPICDVCGQLQPAGVHSTQETLDDEKDAEPDPYDFVHAKGGRLPGEETVCGLHATSGKSLRTHEDDDKVTCSDCLAELHVDDRGDETEDLDPEFAGPHAYDAGPDDVCLCGLPFEDNIHATTHPRSTVPDPFAAPQPATT